MSLDAAQRAVADFAILLPEGSDGRRILYSHRRAVARAVIEAIMEPDAWVLEAGNQAHAYSDTTDIWQAMLRALLAETGERGDD